MKINYNLESLQSGKIAEGSIVPLYTKFLGDSETPISLYQKLKSSYTNSFLLESAESDEQVGRYSFLGFGFRKKISFKDGICHLQTTTGEVTSVQTDDPFLLLKNELQETDFVYDKDLPRLQGGYIGFVAYDCVKYFDKISLPQKSAYQVPELQFVLPENLIIFDNLKKEIYFLSYLQFQAATLARDYQQSIEKLDSLISNLQNQPSADFLVPTDRHQPVAQQTDAQQNYQANVNTALTKIHDGEIFQIVLSTRQHKEVEMDSLQIYRQLRNISPSPYMYLLDFEDLSVIGSSPETLIQIENKQILVRPIAGTRPRGSNNAADEKLAKDLLADNKELAEHRMLVDLARNDVGRIAKPGSVQVASPMHVQKYSHVMHLVSDVKGILDSGKTPFDAFQACFPAGTLSGAPKIRAMQIISQLEPERRGIYGGAVGYFDFSGNMDFAIAIRTIVKKGNSAYIQSGAGIVFDSKPENEFNECYHKALSSLAATLWKQLF